MGHSTAQAMSANNACSALASSCSFVLAFDGAERYGAGWGAQAIVGDYQVSSVCNASSAWTMIDNQEDYGGFAQSGYARISSWSTKTTYYFYEYADANKIYNPVMLGAMTKGWGGADEFTTYYNSGTGFIQMMINGKVEDYYHADWNADDQQWFAETHANEDYVVGGTNHHSVFGSVQYLFSGVWYNLNTPSFMSNNTYAGSYSASGSGFYVWDKRVS